MYGICCRVLKIYTIYVYVYVFMYKVYIPGDLHPLRGKSGLDTYMTNSEIFINRP